MMMMLPLQPMQTGPPFVLGAGLYSSVSMVVGTTSTRLLKPRA